MSQAIKKPFYTAEEYLALEGTAEFKSEYYHGELYSLAGGSFNHSLIAANVLTAFSNALAGGDCLAFGSDLRLEKTRGHL